MSKQKTVYTCNGCAYKSVKWIGCCPGCSTWDSFIETVTNLPAKRGAIKTNAVILQPLSSVITHEKTRMLSGISEWDRVVGNGIMPGSLLVLTGDPGIGKSTLLLQVCNKIAQSKTVFYFSTEESIHQVKQRAQRLSCISDQLFISDEANLETIVHTVEQKKPDLLIIDSIQNCFLANATSAPGSIAQLRESTFQLMRPSVATLPKKALLQGPKH